MKTAPLAPVAVLIRPDWNARAFAERGQHQVYRQGELNRCPQCGRSHWQVGRSTAECSFCATAMPIAR